MVKLEQYANLIMTEETEEGLHAYPLIDEDLYKLVVYKYKSKFDNNIKPNTQIEIINWVDNLVYSNELSLKLGDAYNKSYREWEADFYKDADNIEEEMWRFENEGKLKYKGYIEEALEKAEEFKGNINYDITPNLLEQEQTIIPYIEHDESSDEVVSLEDSGIELVELE